MDNKAESKVYEVSTVINDILNDAERGKLTWYDALKQMKSELKSIDFRTIKSKEGV